MGETTTGTEITFPATVVKNISDWLQAVSIRVPGANKVDIDSAVRTIVREFCDKTRLYIRQLDAIDIVEGVSAYTLLAPTDCAIVSIERVEVNQEFVEATSLDLLDRSTESWRQQESNQPSAYMVDAERILQFKDTPTETVSDGLVVWVALKPSPTTDMVPEFIFADWFETILNGTVAYLLRVPNKPWTSLQGSEYFYNLYDGYTSDAKAKKYTGKTKISIRVQSQPFSVIG